MRRGVKPPVRPKFVTQVYGKALKAKHIDSKYSGFVGFLVTTIQDFHLTHNSCCNFFFKCVDTKDMCTDVFDVGVTVRKRKICPRWWVLFLYKIVLYKMIVSALLDHGIVPPEDTWVIDYLNMAFLAYCNTRRGSQ